MSLLVHRDSSSFVSRWTDNLSKLSHVFEFDKEVLSTRVYENVFRNTFKRSIRHQAMVVPKAPVYYCLLAGDNNVSKVNIERSILSCHTYKQSADAAYLVNSDLALQRSCVKYTLMIIRDIYGKGRTFAPGDIEQLLVPAIFSEVQSGDSLKRYDEDDSLLQTIAAFWTHPDFLNALKNWDEGQVGHLVLTVEEAQEARR